MVDCLDVQRSGNYDDLPSRSEEMGLVNGSITPGQSPGSPPESAGVPMESGILDLGSDRHNLIQQDEAKRKLAKKANRIYRSICQELEIDECFFYGFRAWSDFVDGKMTENTFYERVKTEAQHSNAKRNR